MYMCRLFFGDSLCARNIITLNVVNGRVGALSELKVSS